MVVAAQVAWRAAEEGVAEVEEAAVAAVAFPAAAAEAVIRRGRRSSSAKSDIASDERAPVRHGASGRTTPRWPVIRP